MFGFGDVRTWTAICTDSKLVPCGHIADRTAASANVFINDFAGRIKHRVKLTTDGHRVYVDAVEGAFGPDINYAMLSSYSARKARTMKRITVLLSVQER